MKRLIVMAAAAALLTSVSMSAFASTKSYEHSCKAQAEKHKIAADKMDAYIKQCVERHEKWAKRKHKKMEKKMEKKKEMKEAPKAAAPAAPATPAEPAK